MRLRFLLVAWLFSALLAFGQTHPNLDRGFDPAKVYQFGEVDAVDLYNGHLTLTIPLGPRYPVSERLSYGLTLTYNSNIWAYESWPATDSYSCTAALPKRASDLDWNAGLGFSLTLGDLIYRSNIGVFEYFTPDGATKTFVQTLRDSDTGDPTNVFYTRDGSYLRLTWQTNISPKKAIIEFPDGTRHVFTNYQGSYYRLTEITDAFQDQQGQYPNKVSVSYLSSPDRVVITDAFGRSQTITYSSDSLAIPSKYVTSVTLSGFSGDMHPLF